MWYHESAMLPQEPKQSASYLHLVLDCNIQTSGLGLEAGSKEEAGIIRMLEFGSHLDLERMQAATLPLDNISYRRESAI